MNNEEPTAKYNPHAIKDHLKELVYMMHGSFEGKQKIADSFHLKFPDCSKKSIDKKMRDLFVKEKKTEDPKPRYYATESTLADLNLEQDQQLALLFQERLDSVNSEIAKYNEEQAKLKEEKKQQKHLLKQE